MQKPTLEDIKYTCSIHDIDDIQSWYRMAFFDVIREVCNYYDITGLQLFKEIFNEPKYFNIYDNIYNQTFDQKSLRHDFAYIISTQNDLIYLPLSILCFSGPHRQSDKEIIFAQVVNDSNIIYWFSDEYYKILNLHSYLPNIFNFDHNGIENSLSCLLLEPQVFFPSFETFLTLEKYRYFKLQNYVDLNKEYLWAGAVCYHNSAMGIKFIEDYILCFEIPDLVSPEILKYIEAKVLLENFLEYISLKSAIKSKKIKLLQIKDILIETDMNLVYQALYHTGSQLNDEIITLKKIKRDLYTDSYIKQKNERLYLFKVLK